MKNFVEKPVNILKVINKNVDNCRVEVKIENSKIIVDILDK